MASLQSCGETFYGSFEGQDLVGAISFTREDKVVTICRVMVHPEHFRKGIAGRLLGFVMELAKDCNKVLVSTGTLNVPARNFYIRYGFQEPGKSEVAKGVFITHFEKVNR